MRLLFSLHLSFIALQLVNGFYLSGDDFEQLCGTNSWTEVDLKVIQNDNDTKRIVSDRCVVHLMNPPLGRVTKKIIELLPKKGLKILKISGKVNAIDDDSFSPLSFLKHLVLDGVDLGNSEIYGTKGGFIKNVEQLDLSKNDLSNATFFKTESKTTESIDFYGNHLQTVPEELKNFPNLKTLSMFQNEVKNISLQQTLTKLTYLDLSRNSLAGLSGLRHFPNVVYLNLSDNMIPGMTDEFFQDTRYSLEELRLDFNSIEFISLPIIFNFPKLKVLSLQYNRLRKIIPTVRQNKTMALEYMNLGRNELDDLPYNFLRWFPSLQTLKLNHNKLSILRTGTFISLNKLQHLDLSHNEFVQLDIRRLIPLESLNILDISKNKIETIDYGSLVTHIPSLEKIGIDGNSLFCENLVETLTYLESNNVIVETGHCEERAHIKGICCEDTAKNYTKSEPNLIPISIMKQNQKKLDEILKLVRNSSHEPQGTFQALQDAIVPVSKSTFWTGVGIIIAGLLIILCLVIFSLLKQNKIVLPVHV